MPQLTTHTARLFLILATVALTAVLVLALPQSVEAQGGWFQDAGCEGADCQLCHLVEVSNSIIIWVIGVLFVIFAVIMAVVGFQLVTSAGTAAAKQAAKSRFINAIIGFIIVLAAWLIIDTIMRALLAGGEGRVDGRFFWAEVQCLDVQTPGTGTADTFGLDNQTYPDNIQHPTPGQSRGTAYSTPDVAGMSDAEVQALARSIANLSADEADALIAQRAAELGIADQTQYLQALMRVESGGCRNNVSPAGALGCMQIMPGTARQYDPSLRNLTDAQVRQRLLDPNYNINLGVQIYQDLYTTYNGDLQRTWAGYNGGPGANNPSRDCPGLMRWQCEWDNPAHTIPNTGYRETRNYVRRVQETANNLP